MPDGAAYRESGFVSRPVLDHPSAPLTAPHSDRSETLDCAKEQAKLASYPAPVCQGIRPDYHIARSGSVTTRSGMVRRSISNFFVLPELEEGDDHNQAT